MCNCVKYVGFECAGEVVYDSDSISLYESCHFDSALMGYHFKVSLGRNSLVTVLEGGPSSEWWRVETDQGVQVCANTI